MTTGWNRRRPTRITLPAHAQCVRLIDSAADQTWTAVRVPALRSDALAKARKFLEMARACRSEVGPVLP
jgi:hypothetical protein